MIRRVLAALALALFLAACGGGRDAGEGGGATASLWVTRDHGSEVVLTATVPAGITVMEALTREAEVETAYGGRFVQAIDGIAGSRTKQVDWFYFLNGIEADVGAAEMRLHPGDVAWWDYRSWRERMSWPVVVGAFPEPFLHGWNGERRPVEVRFPPELAEAGEELERLLGRPGGGGAAPNVFLLEVRPGAAGARLTATRREASSSAVTFSLAGSATAAREAALALARDPAIVRFRYEARFDERGNVVG